MSGWSGQGSRTSARPAAGRRRRHAGQGPLQHRSGLRHGAVATAPAPPTSGRTARTARSARAVHHRPGWTHRQRRDPRTAPRRCPSPTTRPHWVTNHRATRPKGERKIARLMRRRHGGRRARVRGTTKTAAGFALLAAAINLVRVAELGVPAPPEQDGPPPQDEPERRLTALPSRQNAHLDATAALQVAATVDRPVAKGEHPRQRSPDHRRCNPSRPRTAV